MVTTPTKHRVEQDGEVDCYWPVIGLIIDKLTTEAIRQLIKEIEAEIAKRSIRQA